MTGMTVMIIHSGLLPETMNCSTILNRFATFLGLSSVVDFRDLDPEVGGNLLEVERDQHIADRFSAVLAVNLSAPYWSCALRYCSW